MPRPHGRSLPHGSIRNPDQIAVAVDSTRQELNVDVAAVLEGMSGGELARLAENVRRELEIREIEVLIEDPTWLTDLRHGRT